MEGDLLWRSVTLLILVLTVRGGIEGEGGEKFEVQMQRVWGQSPV